MSDPIARLNTALEGRYAIKRELGEGGMATVYLAEDLKHHREVALKVLKPELAAVVGGERFLAEIETTAKLKHPHILPLFDSGQSDSFLYYVMPYVEGESLRDRINKDKQLPVDEAVEIARKVAGALQHAHEHGVVHRDIKPGNILFQDNEPVVTDFGIALAAGVAGGTRLTETGLSVGTPFYMSPEQATGDQDMGPPSDTYSLACVLYEMLVGDPPYSGSTAQAVLGKIIQGLPVSATAARRTVPANVDATIRKALEKLPADRFTTAHEFARALTDLGFRHGKDLVGTRVDAGMWKGFAISASAIALVFATTTIWALFQSDPAGSTARFELDLHDVELFYEQGVSFDLSPDGSRFVFVGTSPDGARGLWLRRLDQLEPIPIPGTENGLNPRFSPDGESVLFLGVGGIRTVSLLGAPPTTVFEGGGGAAAWGPDGMIYRGGGAQGLQRASESGGEEEQVTTLAPNEITHNSPDVLPNGRGVLFSRNSGPGQGRRIAVVSLETGEVRDLFEGEMARYSSSGHILYTSADGILFAAPFDVDRLEVTGPAVALVEGVYMANAGNSFFSISESGSLAYFTGGQGELYQVVVVDRTGTGTPIDVDWSFDAGRVFPGMALSPDGTELAIGIWTRGRQEDIWIKELPDGPLSLLTSEPGPDARPWWSPDGSSLTFISARGGQPDVWQQRADGTGSAELLLDMPQVISEAVTSPGGEWILARVNNAQARDFVGIRVGADSVPIALLDSQANETAISFSPDGRWIAFESDETAQKEIIVRPFPDVESGRVQVSVDGGYQPRWSHSGAELFYVNSDREFIAAQIETDPTFSVIDRETLFIAGEEYRFNELENYALYEVMPDDETFLMYRSTGAVAQSAPVLVQNFFEELRQVVPDP